jgi:rubrerythrin
MTHRAEAKLAFYRCGKCKGNIRYVVSDGKPDTCPECGYGHGTRPVNDVPSEVRIDLNNP